MLAKINEFDKLGEEFDEVVFPLTCGHSDSSPGSSRTPGTRPVVHTASAIQAGMVYSA